MFFFLFEGSPKTLGQHKRCEISQHFFISNEPLPKFTLKSHKLLFKKGSFSGTPSRIENLQLQILRQKKGTIHCVVLGLKAIFKRKIIQKVVQTSAFFWLKIYLNV